MILLKQAPSVETSFVALYLIAQINGIFSRYVEGTGKNYLTRKSGNSSMTGTFLYFAYGSNLLAQRIHINNPSAKRAGTGKLKDYQLDFMYYSKRWKGASATIVNKKGGHVWGALWEIDNVHLESLDRQEGVHSNIYVPLDVNVETPEGNTVTARVYQQTKTPPEIDNIEDIPDERKPSAVYLSTIIKGAEESGLPEEYQSWLKRIPHNGYNGHVDIGLELNIIK